ncbi:MAG TPA: hypothetical protein VGE76_17960 [Opitutaceae bacterium]
MILPYTLPLLPYVLFALFVGYLGSARKFGFWGNFFVTLVLTPLVGVVVLLAQEAPKKKES